MASVVFTPLNISLPQKKSQTETLIREQKKRKIKKKKLPASSLQICLSSSSLPSPVYRVQRNSPTLPPECDSLLRSRSCYTIYVLTCAVFEKSPSNSAWHQMIIQWLPCNCSWFSKRLSFVSRQTAVCQVTWYTTRSNVFIYCHEIIYSYGRGCASLVLQISTQEEIRRTEFRRSRGP